MDKKIEPKTDNQRHYIESINNNKITFCDGPAGTGKTYLATLIGLCGLLQKKYQKLIISRPLVQSDSNSGYLPGTLDDKLAPYIKPVMDVLEFSQSKKELEELIKFKRIEVIPFGYMRGLTFNESFVIFEECQNCTYEQLILGLTRFGKECKMVLSGDVNQSDLSYDRQGGFSKIIGKLVGLPKIGIVHLENQDIVREPIIKLILEHLT